ncbi:UDP-N-acetylmuramoyl-L-alanine--D-glutamate ligase [Pelistega ratti]|uniref:UDP-N-acetylmuramoyl-L-alanine--D-glutamate ligase n=1 Tax=Pelistega ratti TaxID=2652177 RepID=UPI001357796B|nr:UDP-N-acetylmuramoyl-L-alanine--D-glutamate ligase [Pelistega ratti]
MNHSVNFDLNQKTILVLGLGETGLAASRWCVQQGATVKVADTREKPSGLEALQSLGIPTENYYLGETKALSDDALQSVHCIVLSPGLSPFQPDLQPFLEKAVSQGIEVIGEIELFARALQSLKDQIGYAPKVLAITGTNGKTTVTTMVRDMCLQAGKQAIAAGNISPSALDALQQALTHQTLPDVWVLELSSFQLHTVVSLHPHASVVLNITQDHLDWHGSMAHYIQSKAKLLALSDTAIVNRDDDYTLGMVSAIDDEHICSFGSDEPPLANDLGIEHINGMAWLCVNEQDDFDVIPHTKAKKKVQERPTRQKTMIKRLMPADAMRVRGRHNALNALAAIGLCRAIDLPYAPLLTTLRHYEAQAHRSNFVRMIQGVEFIDDSKGTNVGATQAALVGLGRPVVIILGGLGKGQDFSPLFLPIKQYARAVLLIGQDKEIIRTALESTGVPMEAFDTLEAAVQSSMQYAKEGDIVLLSPACASMDMFKNYHHRGEVFVHAVNQLAVEMGELM